MRRKLIETPWVGIDSHKAAFEQKFILKEVVTRVHVCGKGFMVRGKSSCKGPEVELSLACLWRSRGSSVA